MTAGHVRELDLRRWLDGEALAEGTPEPHLKECASCRERLSRIQDEQRQFEATIPWDRFEQGVRAAALRAQRASPQRRWVPLAGWALAAALLLTVAVGPLLSSLEGSGRNRLKGGAEVVLRVGGDPGTPQREVVSETPELLAVGERVRIGYVASGYRFVAALSVDEQGAVTALYPEAGVSLPAEQGQGVSYLPESLEFTGDGAERVWVVLTENPVSVDTLKQGLHDAFNRAGGELERMPLLHLPVRGEQFCRTVLKPSSR